MNQRKENNTLQNILLIAIVLLLAYAISLLDSASSYRAVVEPAPDTAVITHPTPDLVIIEEPAVIIATGAPPSLPVVAPVPTATVAEPVEAPTHPPLPGSMQEAYEQGYWAMPITPAQFELCKADASVNPACQFYAKED